MVDVLLTVFWGLVLLIVLVLIHELGHFVAARAFGTRVTEFMIGMPGPNIGFEHNGCRYGVTCIPLGGYNRITGMEGGPEDENLEQVLAYTYRHGSVDALHVATGCGISEDDATFALDVLDGWGSINKPGRSNKTGKYCAPKTAEHTLGEPREVADSKALLDSERAQTYRGLSTWKRLVVLFAGPVMNVVLAVVLFVVAFSCIGTLYTTTTVSDVVADSPAALAGIQPGDTITAVDGVEVESVSELSSSLAQHKAGDEVAITYVRDGQSCETKLALTTNESGRVIIGIYGTQDRYRMNPIESLQSSLETLALTVQSYANLVNPQTAAETVSNSTSIVGISVVAKQAADTDISSYLYILALVSLCLGVVNLVPVPPLDGGKIVTEVVEKVIRRPIPVSVINYTSVVFIVLMMLFFIFMVGQDVTNFIL